VPSASRKVWAYEPSSATARYLRNSIACNELSNLDLFQTAVCDRAGTGRLHLHERAELNRLGANGDGEEVSLTTIDRECAARACGHIDFVKMDAEGGELDIVRGGETFFCGAVAARDVRAHEGGRGKRKRAVFV
jgi:FkbM family methyltransferase